ncbi:MAG: HAD-IIB family hydrolase [Spirochaetota bacterium]
MNELPLIFSDVDGTILDFVTYSYKDSLPAIELCASREIPLILVSSKTYTEMKHLVTELSLTFPFVFENGAGIAYPSGKVTITGKLVDELKALKPIIKSLIDDALWVDTLQWEELSNYTGLSTSHVAAMIERNASLLFISKKTLPCNIDRINQKIAHAGIAITSGGKFYTVMDRAVHKGIAINAIQKYYKRKAKNKRIITYGIGDGINDSYMFKAVDKAYFVGDDTIFPLISSNCYTLCNSTKKGPEGFRYIVTDIVKSYSET